MPRLVRLISGALLALIGSLAALAQGNALPAGVPAFALDVPPGRALADITTTLVAASSARTWTIREKSEGRVVVQLVHRKVDATVTYVFSEQKVYAFCEAYEVDSKGKRGKPEQPTRWLKYLQEDLTRMLGATPAAVGRTPPVLPAPPPPSVASTTPAPLSPTAPPPSLPSAPAPGATASTFVSVSAPAPAAPPSPKAESVQLLQYPTEAISPLSYYSRVYVVRPKGVLDAATSIRVFDETPGAQRAGPGQSLEVGSVDDGRVLGWNRPAGVLSLRADTGGRGTPRLALEVAAGKSYYLLVEGSGASARFKAVPEAEGEPLLAAAKPVTAIADAPDSLDAYLVAAASDGRADAVKKFLSSDRSRSYERALTASIDQAQPQVTTMLVQAGATLPAADTPDARFRTGAIQKATADLLASQGKSGEAKKYYEQAMALFAAVKPDLMAAAEAKFKKARETTTKDSSFWSTAANVAMKALAASAGGSGSQPSGNQAGLSQLLALKDSGTFDQFFAKLKTNNAATPTANALVSNQEIPQEVAALLEGLTNKAVLDKTLSDRCDLLIAEIRKQLAQQGQ